MSHIVTWQTTNIGTVSYHPDTASATSTYHACVTNDYIDVIEAGPKTNVLLDAAEADLDDSTQYFFGIRMRAFQTYNKSGAAHNLSASDRNTATQLQSNVYTYGGGGENYGLGEILDGLPTTGFLRPPTDIVIPTGGYASPSSGVVRYFASGSSNTTAVIPMQSGVTVGDVSASMNLTMNTPASTTKIVMPLLYVPQAFMLKSSNLWLWCYPMIYNAQGVPYGS